MNPGELAIVKCNGNAEFFDLDGTFHRLLKNGDIVMIIDLSPF